MIADQLLILIIIFMVFCLCWLLGGVLRTKTIVKVAKALDLSFSRKKELGDFDVPASKLFEVGSHHQCINIIEGVYKESFCAVFDYRYVFGNSDSRGTILQTVFLFKSEKNFPFLEVYPKVNEEYFLLTNIPEELNIKVGNPSFDQEYTVQAGDVKLVKAWFNKSAEKYISRSNGVSMSAQGNMMMFYQPKKRVSAGRLAIMLDSNYKLFKALECSLPS